MTPSRPLLTVLAGPWLVLALAGCPGDDEGDDGDDPGDQGAADAGVDADPAAPDAGPDDCRCLALGSDFTGNTGAGILFGVPSLAVTPVGAGAVSGDPVVRRTGDKLYVVNRFGFDNVTVVDAVTGQVESQFSTGMGTNPYDIAVAGGKAYVPAYGTGELLVFDLADTMAMPVAITLPTASGETDDNPEPASIAIVGDKAYVTLQHLEMFAPVAKGGVAIVELASNTVLGEIELTSENPTGSLEVHGSDLFVTTTPDFTPTTGCVEKITTTGTPGATCLASAVALGGFPAGLAIASTGAMYVISGQSFTMSKLLSLGAGGEVGGTPFNGMTQSPSGVATCKGRYLVANDSAVGGVRVYAAENVGFELTLAPLDPGEPALGAITCFPR